MRILLICKPTPVCFSGGWDVHEFKPVQVIFSISSVCSISPKFYPVQSKVSDNPMQPKPTVKEGLKGTCIWLFRICYSPFPFSKISDFSPSCRHYSLSLPLFFLSTLCFLLSSPFCGNILITINACCHSSVIP